MTARRKTLLGGALVGMALAAFSAGVSFAQVAPSPTPSQAPGTAPTHEQMHQMMDAMHGAGASDRMHEAMGPEAEQWMDQCVAMMGMMQNTGGMMGGTGGMSGMMGGQNGQTMQDMMGTDGQ